MTVRGTFTGQPAPIAPRASSLDAGRSALPRPLTSFIAREREQREIVKLLHNPEVRLLSLTGPGGIGKTRLAIRAAEDVSPEFEHVWFISLASIRDHRLLFAAIGRALGVRESEREGMANQLVEAIGSTRALLVLDNFEQIASAGPDLCFLLAYCPELTALVTTRTVLRVSGEFEYPVPPLPMPPLDAGLSIAAIESWPTIRLFVERARAVDTHFTLTQSNVNDVAEICLALEGLPLAIELATVQLRVFTPHAMRRELQHRLELLVDGPLDQPERLQTMRNAIRWSYDLLPMEQRSLFLCTGVFAGSFSLEALQAVCLAAGGSPQSTAHALTGLIDSSLVHRVDDGDGDLRFAMLETVREFARELQETACDIATLHEAHARYYLQLAAESEPRLIVSGSAEWVKRLGYDRANLREAVHWAFERDEPELVLRLSGTLLSLAYARGEPAESLRWLLRALDSPGNASAEEIADALFTASALAQVRGDLSQAMGLGQKALDVSRHAGYRFGEARALIGLGIGAEWAEQTDLAAELYHEANQIMREREHAARLSHWRVLPLANLADIALIQHQYAKANELGQQAVGEWREAGYLWGIAQALGTVAAAHCERGALDASRVAYQEALELWLACADGRGISGTIAGVAGLTLARREPELAARLLGAAESVRLRLGVEFVAHHLYAQGQIARVRASLPAPVFEEHWASGEALAIGDAAELAHQSLNAVPEPSRVQQKDLLSRRETEILRLVAEGLPDREIADDLSISPRTVQSHVTSILTKLDARSRAEAVASAIRSGAI
ncbi:MAG: hypothetical protein KF883_09955 [Thermomicrobiales bacterium]|nr:hypothetical protein [Thermomicrobiales bacterium]